MKRLKEIPRPPNSTRYAWWIMRALLLVWGIVMVSLGHRVQLLQAIFGLIFTFLWDMFQIFGGKTFIIKVPYIYQTLLNFHITVGCVLGTTVNVFTDFEHIDIPMHIIAGFISAYFGYDFAQVLHGEKRGKLGPALSAMFAISFACFIMVGWEIYEFSMDQIHGMHLQMSWPDSDSGLIDTMWDFICGAFGAVVGTVFTALTREGVIGKRRKKKDTGNGDAAPE